MTTRCMVQQGVLQGVLARAKREIKVVETALGYLASEKHHLKTIHTQLEAAKRDWSVQMRTLRYS